MEVEAASAGSGRIEVTTTLQAAGAAHAVPTGEPLRRLVLTLEVRACDHGAEAIEGQRTVFARTLVDAAGVEAHHSEAVREASDTRLVPGSPRTVTSSFTRPAGCADEAVATATLTYLRFPVAWARAHPPADPEATVVGTVSATVPAVP